MSTDRIAELDAKLARLEGLPDSPARQLAFQTVQGLMEVYGDALARVVDLAPEVISRLAEDELLAHLLLLHNLHPVDVRTRVEAALESVRPYLATHGGGVELLEVQDGVARVRLEGTCNGCPSSMATLQQAIERAVYDAAPDVERVEAEGAAPRSAVISLESLVCPVPA